MTFPNLNEGTRGPLRLLGRSWLQPGCSYHPPELTGFSTERIGELALLGREEEVAPLWLGWTHFLQLRLWSPSSLTGSSPPVPSELQSPPRSASTPRPSAFPRAWRYESTARPQDTLNPTSPGAVRAVSCKRVAGERGRRGPGSLGGGNLCDV